MRLGASYPAAVEGIETETEPQRIAPREMISAAEERFERGRKIVGAVLAPVAFLLVYFVVLRDTSLAEPGRRLSAVLAAVAVLWVSEALPLPVTALLGACLCILFGVADAKTVLAQFAHPIIFLFLGSFFLARAMEIHKLDRRLALRILSVSWIGGRPARVLAAVGVITAAISMWVSNTATTAMMLPIAMGILAALHDVRVRDGLASGPLDARRWPFATGMMLMIAYSASIGGIGTKVGSPPNLITLGALEKVDVHITFFTWMKIMVPMLAVMFVVLFGLLHFMHPDRTRRATAGSESAGLLTYLRSERERLGPWTRGQVNTLIAFLVAITLWIVPGFIQAAAPRNATHASAFFEQRMPETVVALVAALLLFVLPTNWRRGEFTLTWSQAVRIDWGTLILFGGGLSLGQLMFDTGVAKAIGHWAVDHTGAHGVWGLTAAMIVLGIVLSEATSNTASATMLAPIAIAIAAGMHVSPIPPALGACLGASFGFMLPVSTPPNAIAYGSGLVPIGRMMRAGFLFDALGAVVIWAGLRVLLPLMGLA